jgi:NAD(P)-dependent dehydrogenase (short-subunit alcohol dehydrogenase family)
LNSYIGLFLPKPTSLSIPSQVGPKVVELALKSFSQIDGLIINHGVLSPVKRIADSTPEEWRSVFDTNFFSAIALVSRPLPTQPV